MADLTSPAEYGNTSDDLALSFRLELSPGTGHPRPPTRDPEADDLRSLREWLRDDPHVGRHTIAQPLDEAAAPGQMSLVSDVLQFVADPGLETAALVVAILAWRDSRPAASQHEVTIIHNGRRMVISSDPATIDRIVRMFDDEDDDEDD